MSKPALERYDEALALMREAEDKVHSAIVALRAAAARYMRAEADISDDKGIHALAGHAASNRSSWSGGILSASNLIEAAKREAALELLRCRVR